MKNLFASCIVATLLTSTINASPGLIRTPVGCINQVSEWNFYFSQNGVEFYSRWKSSTYGGDFYQLKVVNTTNVKKEVSFSNIEFYSGGSRLIERINGSAVTLQAGAEKYGERDGLWYNVPKGYKSQDVSAKIINVNVK